MKDNRTVDELLVELRGAEDSGQVHTAVPYIHSDPGESPKYDAATGQRLRVSDEFPATAEGLLSYLKDKKIHIDYSPHDLGVPYYVAYLHSELHQVGDIMNRMGFVRRVSSVEEYMSEHFGLRETWYGEDNTFVGVFDHGFLIVPSKSVGEFQFGNPHLKDVVRYMNLTAKRTSKKVAME